jgi:hypothetical protein
MGPGLRSGRKVYVVMSSSHDPVPIYLARGDGEALEKRTPWPILLLLLRSQP